MKQYDYYQNNKERREQNSRKNPLRNVRKIYLPVFAMYSNLAIDTIKALFVPDENCPNANFKPYERLKDIYIKIKNNDEKSDEALIVAKHYISQFKSFYPFSKAIQNPQESDQEVFVKLFEWIEILKDIRNKYSHAKSKDISYSGYIQIELQRLYDIAIENSTFYRTGGESTFKFPQKYRKLFIKDTEKEVVYLDYTGIIFLISLFLRSQDVSSFMSELQRSALENKEGEACHKSIIEQRKRYFKKYPEKIGDQYPPYLQVKNKDFLYGNDIYTYWAIKGHIVPIENKELKNKIKFFDLMNYLQQCPPERVNINFKDSDNGVKPSLIKCREGLPTQVLINDRKYFLRERNNFVSYALEFWDENIAPYFPEQREWKWALFASDKQKQAIKEAKDFNKLKFHEKIIWEKPENDINEAGFETGYPYYVENNNVFFRLKQGENYIVGTMSTKVVYDLFRVLFACIGNNVNKTSIGDFPNKLFTATWNYMYEYLDCTAIYKNSNPNPAVPTKLEDRRLLEIIQDTKFNRSYEGIAYNPEEAKTEKVTYDIHRQLTKELQWMVKKPLTDEELKRRISNKVNLLKEKYSKLRTEATPHQKMNETVEAWFAVLNYGADVNWTHALYPENGQESIIEQYRRITYYLSRLSNPCEGSINVDLQNYLRLCGLYKLLSERRKDLITQSTCLNDYFEKAMQYRLEILSRIEKKISLPFNRSQWKPTEEIRWLKVRTPERAKAYPKISPIPTIKMSTPIEPAILNTDKGIYYATRAVPLFHNFFSKTMGYDSSKIENSISLPDDFYLLDHKLIRGVDFRRLYAIREQDKVLSHIAAYYATHFRICKLEGLSVINSDFQSAQLDIKEKIGNEEITIVYYYRYFKQSRYQISPYLLKGLLEASLKTKTLPSNKTLYFNKLVPRKNEEGKIVFVNDNEMVYPTVIDLFRDYNSSRLKFINKFLYLERKLYGSYESGLQGALEENGYIGFKDYIAITKNRLVKQQLTELKDIRNAALHGYVPAKISVTPENDAVKKILFFKEGMELIDNIKKELS